VSTYVDTSALAKWYLPETGADEFEAWILRAQVPTISSLTLVEMRCMLARLRRMGIFGQEAEAEAYDRFIQDVDERLLAVEPVGDADVRAAAHLIKRVGAHPLRTLDAIHLSVCTSRELTQLATADTVMAAAAEELGIEVVRFD